MRTTSVAIYIFVIFNIGGNAPVLVPILSRALAGNATHTVHVQVREESYYIGTLSCENLNQDIMECSDTLHY